MSLICPFAPLEDDFFSISNCLIDTIMPTLSSSAFKVLCYILRQTRGYRRDGDSIGYSEIKEGTGIKSNTTVSKDLRSLLDKDYIVAIKGSCYETTHYRLNVSFSIDCKPENGQQSNQPVNQKMDNSDTENEQQEQAICNPENEQQRCPENGQASDLLNTRGLNTHPNVVASAHESVGEALPVETKTRKKRTRKAATDGKYTDEFEHEFWDFYPLKDGKFNASESFDVIKQSTPVQQWEAKKQTILAGITRAKQTSQWKRGFIPHASAWLNQHRWEDRGVVGMTLQTNGNGQSVLEYNAETLTRANDPNRPPSAVDVIFGEAKRQEQQRRFR